MDLFEELPYMLGVYRRKLNSAVRMDTRSKAKAAPPYHIYTTSPHNKACLLGQDSTDHRHRRAGEQKLLEAVIRFDLSSADWYVFKETATTDLLFRLLRLDVEKGLEPQAFLAVSYRCPDGTWTRTPVCRKASVPEFYHHLTCALLCSRDSST